MDAPAEEVQCLSPGTSERMICSVAMTVSFTNSGPVPTASSILMRICPSSVFGMSSVPMSGAITKQKDRMPTLRMIVTSLWRRTESRASA